MACVSRLVRGATGSVFALCVLCAAGSVFLLRVPCAQERGRLRGCSGRERDFPLARAVRVILFAMTDTAQNNSLMRYRILLAFAAAIWGLGFIVGKGAIAEVGATWFTGIRFLGSALILFVFMFRHVVRHLNKETLRAGCIIGVFSFLGFWTQFIGLGLTTPSKNAFLSACYCVTVPFIWWVVARRRPSKRVVIAAFVCAVGIGLVSLTESFSIGLGDAVSVLSAFLYGAEIVVISLVMKRHDVLTVTCVQQFVSGALAIVVALFTQPVPGVSQLVDPEFLARMAYIIVMAASVGAVIQNLAQAHLSASESGLLCSLESVFCAAFSVVFVGDVFTLQMLVGFVLIFASIVIAQTDKTSGDEASPGATKLSA